MAVIRPFSSVRPEVKYASRIAALPYDVYNRSEAKLEVEKEPLSFLSIDRAETQCEDSISTYADLVYDKAKERYEEYLEEGYFIRDKDKAYYIYELTMDNRSQTGIVACASIDDYDNNIIKKHEKTREEKEKDRINHVDRLSAQTGPIFLAYPSKQRISDIVSLVKEDSPLYGFTSEDGIKHRVWKISEQDKVECIQQEFKTISSVYIADGHHRAASAVKVGKLRREENPDYTGEEEFNYFLSVLFPADELMILPYNRVIQDLNGLSVEELIAKLSKNFKVVEVGNEPYSPTKKKEFGMYLDKKWYSMELKNSEDYFNINESGMASEASIDKENYGLDSVERLDVSILQFLVLNEILGIEDPRVDTRIDFIGGIRGLRELERRVNVDMKLAFSMYPTSIQELFDVSDEDKLMPPKSTWFEPKLRSGLFIHEIEPSK